MSIVEFESWLKNSIPGIIFLGALGSIVALGLMRGFNRLVPKTVIWLKATLFGLFILLARKIAGAAAKEHAKAIVVTNPHKVRAYYASVVMRFCLYLFIMTWGLIFLLSAALFPENTGLRNLALPSAFVFFFIGGYAIKTYCWLLIPHWLNLDIEEIVKDAINSLKKTS